MYCTRKVNNDITWVGGNDRRLAMFEGVYSIPNGVSYNSYLILDEQTILFDTVDKAIGRLFFENVAHVLDGRKLDYVVVQHMEPDHSATLLDLLCRYTDTKVVCTKKTSEMIVQFFGMDVSDRAIIVKENDTLSTGKHEFQFVMAPMVHWPEVMFTYDKTDKVLFSADAFGTFNALNGALFADELDFYNSLVGEARRYYANIIGKYGAQVQSALKKISTLDVRTTSSSLTSTCRPCRRSARAPPTRCGSSRASSPRPCAGSGRPSRRAPARSPRPRARRRLRPRRRPPTPAPLRPRDASLVPRDRHTARPRTSRFRPSRLRGHRREHPCGVRGGPRGRRNVCGVGLPRDLRRSRRPLPRRQPGARNG